MYLYRKALNGGDCLDEQISARIDEICRFSELVFPLLYVHVSTGSVFKRIELVEYSLIKLVNKKIICFLVCIHLCQMCEHELLR